MAITTYFPPPSPAYIQPTSSSYVVQATPQTVTYNQNGYSQDVTKTKFPLQFGVPVNPPYMFDIIPTITDSNCVSAPNTYVAGGQPLVSAIQGSYPNIVSKPITINGQTGVMLDCERCLALYSFSGSTIAATTLTISGYDYLLNPITFSISLGTTITNPVIIPFPILIIMSAVFSNTFVPVGVDPFDILISIGTSNLIGLPYLITNSSYVFSVGWQGTAYSSSQVTPGNNWRVTTPTATNNISRGYVTLPTPADNSSMLTCCYYVEGLDSELNTEMSILNQSSLKVGNVQKNTSSQYPSPTFCLPNITEYDLRGVVYPGDSAFITTYNQLKAS